MQFFEWDNNMESTANEILLDLVIDDEDIGKMSVVAKIFSRKRFSASAIKSPLKSAWSLEGNLDACELGDNLFALSFENKQVKDKVLAIGAWNYDRCLMVLQDFNGKLKPSEFVFDKATFWVQVHDLPLDLMTIQVGKALGNHIGQFLDVDAFKNSVAWGRFLSIKVSVAIDKPLKRGCTLNIPNKGKTQVFYRYENLPEICYHCGTLSCFGQDCDVDNPVFGAWLNANSEEEMSNLEIREEDDFVMVGDSNAKKECPKEIESRNFHLHYNDDESIGSIDHLYNRRSYKVYCKAAPDFHLTMREGGAVVLARSDPSDPFQSWIKDKTFSKEKKDEAGCQCFCLVNKGTGQSLKPAAGVGQRVQLVPYNPVDESVLWSLSEDLGDGYRAMRVANDITLNMDAFQGDVKSGGVHEGTNIVLWGWNYGANQLWKVERDPR